MQYRRQLNKLVHGICYRWSMRYRFDYLQERFPIVDSMFVIVRSFDIRITVSIRHFDANFWTIIIANDAPWFDRRDRTRLERYVINKKEMTVEDPLCWGWNAWNEDWQHMMLHHHSYQPRITRDSIPFNRKTRSILEKHPVMKVAMAELDHSIERQSHLLNFLLDVTPK